MVSLGHNELRLSYEFHAKPQKKSVMDSNKSIIEATYATQTLQRFWQ